MKKNTEQISFSQELVETKTALKRIVNTGLTFISWPNTRLQMNTNVGQSKSAGNVNMAHWQTHSP